MVVDPPEGLEVDSFSFEDLHSNNWRDIVDRFSQDMDPWAIDIVKIAERFREYVEQLERYDLEIPARMVFICAFLLRMKADMLSEVGAEQRQQEEFEEEFEEFDEFHEDFVEKEEELEVPEDNVKPRVKKRPVRRVSVDELKEALGKALEIQKKRRKRREERLENQDEFIDLNSKDISEKLDKLMERLENFFNSEGENISFERILERQDKEEKLEKFNHILHLETDEKIMCKQEDFFGEIRISPLENN